MYINRKLPEIPVGDWAKKHDIPQPGLDRCAWHGRLTPETVCKLLDRYQ